MKTMKYFSATWCGPCKSFKPVMNEIAGEGHQIACQYNIRAVPTTIIEENGVEVDRFTGVLPKQSVLSRLS